MYLSNLGSHENYCDYLVSSNNIFQSKHQDYNIVSHYWHANNSSTCRIIALLSSQRYIYDMAKSYYKKLLCHKEAQSKLTFGVALCGVQSVYNGS